MRKLNLKVTQTWKSLLASQRARNKRRSSRHLHTSVLRFDSASQCLHTDRIKPSSTIHNAPAELNKHPISQEQGSLLTNRITRWISQFPLISYKASWATEASNLCQTQTANKSGMNETAKPKLSRRNMLELKICACLVENNKVGEGWDTDAWKAWTWRSEPTTCL